MTRLIVLSDVHGNAVALEAVRKAIRSEKPDLVAVAGDLVLNGPDPAGAVDLLREMEADGAAIISGNTDVAVADFDYAAAFPWMTDGVPDIFRRRPPSGRTTRSVTSGSRGCATCRPSGDCATDDGTMILVCHASPGSADGGLRQGARSQRRHRARRADRCTDHRLPSHAHPRGPRPRLEAGRQRRPRPGYVFDGDPTASWARIDVDDGEITAEINRTDFDILAVANAISARGLPGDVYRAATVRTGKLVR